MSFEALESGFEVGHKGFRRVKTILGDFVAFYGETHDVLGLARPMPVAVWRSGDVAGLGLPAALSLRQSGSYLGALIWRCGFGAWRSKAPKVRRCGNQGWVILASSVIWLSGSLALSDLGNLAIGAG